MLDRICTNDAPMRQSSDAVDDLSNMLSDLIAACYHDACVVIIIMECALWVGPRGRTMRKPKHDVTSTDK